MMKKVLFLMAEGFEDIELSAPFDILIRGGVKVTLASIHEDSFVESSHGMSVRADALLSEVRADDFCGLFLPGGGRGVENLRASEDVLDLVRTMYEQNKWVTAICAGPTVLAAAGILHDKRVTSYPSEAETILPYCKSYSEDRVVVDGKVVTSRAAGTAEEFALKFLSLLEGDAKAAEVRKTILAR
ncbi:MAG: DJ-1/PfpI family protein [Fibrobacteraceae bacterium]|nr:DJ-1/PfpI family protein [Fibrobacteraceae bacterium]